MSSGKGERGTYATTPARRAKILRAALAAFAEHGYERSSLRDIAARAGVTHAGLRHHFTSKGELLTAALAHLDTEEGRTVSSAVAAGLSAPDAVTDLLAQFLRDPGFVRSWLSLSVAATDPRHPAHAYFAGRHERALAQFRDTTVAEADSARFDAETKAALIVAVHDGLMLQWLLDPTRDVLTPYHRLVGMILEAGAAGEAESPEL